MNLTLSVEATALATRYGVPKEVTARLADGNFSPITKGDRIGEVCMVMRRPDGHLLTARKEYYPPGIFRLLTGGITPGESIEQALLRESYEETGLSPVIRHFLAIISYLGPAGESLPFHTFAFLLDIPGDPPRPLDPDERVAAFREILPADLPHLATTLDQLPRSFDDEINGAWQSWGRFRAISHHVIAEALVALNGRQA